MRRYQCSKRCCCGAAIAGAGVGAGPGAGIGATFGGLAGALGGLFSGLISGFQYMATYTNTTTVKENINVASNVISQNGDITLTSNASNTNPNAQPSTINNNNDINIIGSNVQTNQTLTANVNGDNLNILSAQNTQAVKSTYDANTPNYGEVSANAAAENAVTGSIGGLLSGVMMPVAEGTTFAGFFEKANGGYLFSIGQTAKNIGVDTSVSYLTPILSFGKDMVPLISFPVVTVTRGAISDGIGYGLNNYITQDSQGNSDSTNSNQSTIGELNSNVNYNNLVLK